MSQDKLSDHSYDGIQEYDNPQPAWWTWLFLATALHSAVYFLYYEMGGPGLDPYEAYEEEMAAYRGASGEAGEEEIDLPAIEKGVEDPAALANGKEIFMKFCAACHLADGGGLIGPNLTDDHWLHGGGLVNIFRTVRDGVPAKGMAPWGKQLQPEEMQNVTAYVYTLRGTQPANPKAPQGEIWTEP